MTSVYRYNNAIIINNGKIGISQNCCCDCVNQDACWILEFDLEFLSSVDWGMGNPNIWIPYTGNQVLWVDVSDQSNDRRTCADGVAVDEANPGPPGWEIIIPGAFNANGHVEAGNCEEGISLYMQSDFATMPGGFVMSPAEGINNYSIEEDLTAVVPPGAANQEVIRGTITLTLVVPSTKGDCGCP